jgi:hypothetical protein
MKSAGQDSDFLLLYLVYESVFLIYSARPATLQFVLERLRLADPSERIPVNFLYQTNNAWRLVAILLNPPRQIFQGGDIKFQVSQGLPRMEFRFDVF